MHRNRSWEKIPIMLTGIAIFLNMLNMYVYKNSFTNGFLFIKTSILSTVFRILTNEYQLDAGYLIKLLYISILIVEMGLFIILIVQEWLDTSMFSKFVITYIIMDLTALQIGLLYRVTSLYRSFVDNFSQIRLGGAQAYLPTISTEASIILLLAPLILLVFAYVFYGYEWVSSAEEEREESDYEVYIYAVIIIVLIVFVPFSRIIIQFPNVSYPAYTLRNTGNSIIISKQILGANLTQINVCYDNLYGVNTTSLRDYYIIRPSLESIETAQLYGKPLLINITITGVLQYDEYKGSFVYKTRVKVPTPRPIFNVTYVNGTLLFKVENYPCRGVKTISITSYLDQDTPLNQTIYHDACPYLVYKTDAPIVGLNITYLYLGNFSTFEFYVEKGASKTLEASP